MIKLFGGTFAVLRSGRSRHPLGRCNGVSRVRLGAVFAVFAVSLRLWSQRPLRAQPRSLRQGDDHISECSQVNATAEAGSVAMVSSAAIAGIEVLKSPRYRVTAVARPRWMLTATPNDDSMTPPQRDALNLVPNVALAARLQLTGDAPRPHRFTATWSDGAMANRLSWDELVCPG